MFDAPAGGAHHRSMEAARDRSHLTRVTELAEVFVKLARPDLALPLLQRLVAVEPDEPGLDLRIAEVAQLPAPPEPPPPLEPSAAGLKPEEMIERCLRAGALAVGRDLLRGLVRRPLEPPEAAENLASRLLAVERVLRRLGRREAERGPAPRPSVKHAEQLIAQGRLFDGIEECRLVLERRTASTESRMWVRDLEILLAPVPDIFVPESGAVRLTETTPSAGVRAAPLYARPERTPAEEPAPASEHTPAAVPAAFVRPGRDDDSHSVTPLQRRRADASPTQETTAVGRTAGGSLEETSPERPSLEALALAPTGEQPALRAETDLAAVSGDAAPRPAERGDPTPFPVDVDLGEEEAEQTDLSLHDPDVRRMIDSGDLRGAYDALLHSASESKSTALPAYLKSLGRLCGPGPAAMSAIVTDAETALVGGELADALALYGRAADERPDQLEVVARARDLRFVLFGGRRPPDPPPRVEMAAEELRRVLMKRGGLSQRVQASAGLWGKSAPAERPGEGDPEG